MRNRATIVGAVQLGESWLQSLLEPPEGFGTAQAGYFGAPDVLEGMIHIALLAEAGLAEKPVQHGLRVRAPRMLGGQLREAA